MTDFSIVVDIKASPDRVLAVLFDVERWPEWTSTMMSVRRVDDGPLAVGSKARVRHPTVKPTAMLEDAFLDLSNGGDIVPDPFLGSGSTLIAADKAGRACRGVELDPLYVDVIIRRYEAATGEAAMLIETGETFEDLAARRAGEVR